MTQQEYRPCKVIIHSQERAKWNICNATKQYLNVLNSQTPGGNCSHSSLKSTQTVEALTFRTSDDLHHNPSIYGQEGWWVGKPSAEASRVKYQSCCLWGKMGTAVETPWCQGNARHPRQSLIGLDTLRMADCGPRWCSHVPHRPPTLPQWVVCLPGGKTTPRDASQSSTATAVNVSAGKVEQLLPSASMCLNFG